ncbi:MAG: hypothetical protein WD069_01770 [Planctomycetales bacterium]
MAPVRLLAAALMVAALTGCESFPKWSIVEKIPTPGEVLHNLQPHRIAHLNRGPAPGRGDTFYAVPDSIPELPRDSE